MSPIRGAGRAVPLVAVWLLLASCGQTGADPPGTAPGAPGSVTRPTPTDPENLPVPPRPKSGGPATPPRKLPGAAAAGPRTLTGTVTSGVEGGCWLLNGYLLVGGPRRLLTAGARVTVTGRVEPDLVTTCQQGIPLVVDTVEPA